jgi:cbb3-type cytochrome oxidase subunit 3
MFHRITLEEWYHGAKVFAMILFFLAFALVLLRALGMSRAHAEHMNALPLHDDQDSQP